MNSVTVAQQRGDAGETTEMERPLHSDGAMREIL